MTAEPRRRARCAVCGGRIYRPAVVPSHPASYWLHADARDWTDRPHNAEPAPELEPEREAR